jgi:NADH dehydrogenase/NADH:ubiquinone oxidoreductase subunit G
MGVCFDCLVVVDGVPNTRACVTWVRDGMVVARQDGFGPASRAQ